MKQKIINSLSEQNNSPAKVKRNIDPEIEGIIFRNRGKFDVKIRINYFGVVQLQRSLYSRKQFQMQEDIIVSPDNSSNLLFHPYPFIINSKGIIQQVTIEDISFSVISLNNNSDRRISRCEHNRDLSGIEYNSRRYSGKLKIDNQPNIINTVNINTKSYKNIKAVKAVYTVTMD